MVLLVYTFCVCFLDSYFFFFFSSRRRHTRLQGDWSSDVCSSDLVGIDKRCAPESPDDAGGGRVPQVEKQVRLGGSVQVQTALRDLVRNGPTADRVQRERVRQAE